MQYIACYGDSLIYGFPFGIDYSWTVHVEKNLSVKMLNYGVCGDCCDDIIFRVRQYKLPLYVKHILFLGGANDILQGRKLEAIMDDYNRLVEFCKEEQYFLCIVMPLLSGDGYLNHHLLKLRQEIKNSYSDRVFLLDLQTVVGLDDTTREKNYLDGIHPLATVYESMGKYAVPFLEEWLKETIR